MQFGLQRDKGFIMELNNCKGPRTKMLLVYAGSVKDLISLKINMSNWLGIGLSMETGL